ncbi:MAG: hypothetical protein RQ754_09530 [Desulfuromonadales bacterium]|nr:hypothetical protein [Desulfuromonadales bacterium]
MKIRIRYRHGRLQIVQNEEREEREEQYEDLDFFDLQRINWTSLGVDSIRSMIRGGYDTSESRKQIKK